VCGRGWHSHAGGYPGGEQHRDPLVPGHRPGLPEGLPSQGISGTNLDIFIFISYTRKCFRLQQEKLLKGESHLTKLIHFLMESFLRLGEKEHKLPPMGRCTMRMRM